MFTITSVNFILPCIKIIYKITNLNYNSKIKKKFGNNGENKMEREDLEEYKKKLTKLKEEEKN